MCRHTAVAVRRRGTTCEFCSTYTPSPVHRATKASGYGHATPRSGHTVALSIHEPIRRRLNRPLPIDRTGAAPAACAGGMRCLGMPGWV